MLTFLRFSRHAHYGKICKPVHFLFKLANSLSTDFLALLVVPCGSSLLVVALIPQDPTVGVDQTIDDIVRVIKVGVEDIYS